MMDHQDGFFQGVRDARIYYQAWLPEGRPVAVLPVVHGFAEHSGRYGNLVEHLVPLGYALYALDHLGHGRSEGERVYVERFSDYVDTLVTFVDMVRAWQPGVPMVMFGHSMGGLIAANYLLDHAAGLAGAVLSGALIQLPGDVTPLTLFLAKALSALAPKTRIQGIEAQYVSRDPEVVRAYVDDPLVFSGKSPARTAVEIMNAQQRAMDGAPTITLPVLMVHGSDDRLAPLPGARAFYEALGSADKTLKVYDALFHEVCNEPECGMVLSDIAAWLKAHL
jgi:alpha-beta hydrolase superfamily lysophospholipase